MHYWLGVVSKEHVEKAVKGGFAQVCHGKKAPLTKIHTGDGFIYYSPKVAMNSKTPCKSFTAIGKVKSGKAYQVEMTTDFHPFRIDIKYFPGKIVPVSAVFDRIELTQKKGWGMLLRRGILEISESDFFTIADAMVVKYA